MQPQRQPMPPVPQINMPIGKQGKKGKDEKMNE